MGKAKTSRTTYFFIPAPNMAFLCLAIYTHAHYEQKQPYSMATTLIYVFY